jgi:hypothetical protein
MFVQLKLNNPKNVEKYLFLHILVRLRAITYNGYLVLANWAAWFTTGLFLFALFNTFANDNLYAISGWRYSTIGIGSKHQRQDIHHDGIEGRISAFFRNKLRPSRDGKASQVAHRIIAGNGIDFSLPLEAAGPDLSQNRNQGGWKGITIPPKSLLNLLSGRQHYPDRAYADTPSALMPGTWYCVRGVVLFFRGRGKTTPFLTSPPQPATLCQGHLEHGIAPQALPYH